MSTAHSFHIPVMGTGFTIDSPIKVAKYGISSVISLVDDTLIEEMRKYYCEKFDEPYTAITKYDEDFRARRITEYLNLLDRIVTSQMEDIRDSAFELGSEITKYFEMLPEHSQLKKLYNTMMQTTDPAQKKKLQDSLREQIIPGDINVNIMTKLDRPNFSNKDKSELGPEFSDALSALRGYAQSSLNSAIIFSAGINRRLYSYVENFKDFYADATGNIKKKVVIKVSDYRSCITQGKFFAKKGIWVSEYRIESGLNCGGHAFATDGFLMGPILHEIQTKKKEMTDAIFGIYSKAVTLKKKLTFDQPHEVKITAQGGIGNGCEDRFLREHYQLDGTGWGTPFLLCPEATNVDDPTLQKLSKAQEKDLYLSEVSPLGVPFNNLRGSVSDDERDRRVAKDRPGSACPKGHLVSNTEFTERPICTASRQYQKLKIEQLKSQNLSVDELKEQTAKVTVKSCLCHDLGEGVLEKFNVPSRIERFSAVCPGPNLAYFSKIVSLREMADQIYGRANFVNNDLRPHMFIKELKCYVDYLRKELSKTLTPTDKQKAYFEEFKNNMTDGINYYRHLFPEMIEQYSEFNNRILYDLNTYREALAELVDEYSSHFLTHQTPEPVAIH